MDSIRSDAVECSKLTCGRDDSGLNFKFLTFFGDPEHFRKGIASRTAMSSFITLERVSFEDLFKLNKTIDKIRTFNALPIRAMDKMSKKHPEILKKDSPLKLLKFILMERAGRKDGWDRFL